MKLPDQLARLAPEYRWLALSADLDTAHLIADAHKYFGRATASRPRIVKRFGAARVELLASLANQMGNAYLSDATDPGWRYLVNEPKPLTVLRSEIKSFDVAWHSNDSSAAKNISLDMSTTPSGRLNAAEKAFRLASRLEGPLGPATLNLGILEAARGEHLKSSEIYQDLVKHSPSMLVRHCAIGNAVIANLDAGRLDRCAELSDMSVQIVLREFQGIYYLNRALFSLHVGSVKGTEGCLWSAAKYSQGTRYWQSMLGRVELAKKRLQPTNMQEFDLDRILTRFCEEARN